MEPPGWNQPAGATAIRVQQRTIRESCCFAPALARCARWTGREAYPTRANLSKANELLTSVSLLRLRGCCLLLDVRLNLLAPLLCAGACFAQHFEVGGTVGYGDYRNGSIVSSGGSATAGIGNGVTAGAVFSEDLYQHLSGEVRYLYQNGGPFLSAGGIRGSVQGQSHALHYDMLVHLLPRASRIRPYVEGGAGGKYYENTGSAPVPQPLPRVAALTTQSEWKALFTVGAGVKIRVSDHVVVRGDFLDYITMFPKALFTPVSSGSYHGLFHQLTPLFGLGYTF